MLKLIALISLMVLISSCYGSSSNNSTGLYNNDNDINYVMDLNTGDIKICLSDDDIVICY